MVIYFLKSPSPRKIKIYCMSVEHLNVFEVFDQGTWAKHLFIWWQALHLSGYSKKRTYTSLHTHTESSLTQITEVPFRKCILYTLSSGGLFPGHQSLSKRWMHSSSCFSRKYGSFYQPNIWPSISHPSLLLLHYLLRLKEKSLQVMQSPAAGDLTVKHMNQW